MDPSQVAETQFGIGFVRMAQGQLEAACTAFLAALAADPRHANSLCKLGEIKELRGEPASARDYYQKALQANPAHPAARRKVGNAV